MDVYMVTKVNKINQILQNNDTKQRIGLFIHS